MSFLIKTSLRQARSIGQPICTDDRKTGYLDILNFSQYLRVFLPANQHSYRIKMFGCFLNFCRHVSLFI